jgi:hypothetical protein
VKDFKASPQVSFALHNFGKIDWCLIAISELSKRDNIERERADYVFLQLGLFVSLSPNKQAALAANNFWLPAYSYNL